METPSWYILGQTITGVSSPMIPWTNLLGFLLFICIIIAVIWILYLLVQIVYIRLQDHNERLYNIRYSEIF